MTAAHRSLDGSQMHPGFVDECIDCSGAWGHLTHHEQTDHHPYDNEPPIPGWSVCVCGEPYTAGIHGAAPCNWCFKEPDPLLKKMNKTRETPEFGAPAPWWHRAWCRFVAWWLR